MNLETPLSVIICLVFWEVLRLAIRKFWKKSVDTDYVTTTTCNDRQAEMDITLKTRLDNIGNSVDLLRGVFLAVLMKNSKTLQIDDKLIQDLSRPMRNGS